MLRTIRPGYLVSLHTRVEGGAAYQRVDLDAKKDESGAAVSRWETTRTIEDPDEYERAIVARGKVRSLITAECARTEFGLIALASRKDQLDSAVAAAHKVADDFNATARTCAVRVYTIVGLVASNDVEAIRAINAEVADLVEAMARGTKTGDVEEIRKAANRAREVGALLDDASREKVGAAIDEARRNARELVRRVETDGEDRAQVVADLRVEQIKAARFAFLDLDQTQDQDEPAPQTKPAPRAIENETTNPLAMRAGPAAMDDDEPTYVDPKPAARVAPRPVEMEF